MAAMLLWMGNPAIRAEDGGPCTACRHFELVRSLPSGTFVVCAPVGSFYGNAAAGCRYWEWQSPQEGAPPNGIAEHPAVFAE